MRIYHSVLDAYTDVSEESLIIWELSGWVAAPEGFTPEAPVEVQVETPAPPVVDSTPAVTDPAPVDSTPAPVDSTPAPADVTPPPTL